MAMNHKTLYILIVLTTSISAAHRLILDDTVFISFGGDVMLARRVGNAISVKGAEYPWAGIAEYLRKTDLSIVNLECPICTSQRHMNKEYVFKANPSCLSGLVFAGIDAVVLANNHIFDYFDDGLIETIEHLKKSFIIPIGAGRNANEFFEPAYFWFGNKWVIILALNDTEAAFRGKDFPGCAPTWTLWGEDFAIKTISENVYPGVPIMVYIHWGNEYDLFPTERQTELAHKLIDAGAQAVIGSHPHRIQGVEFYRGGIIAYSLGNLVFDQRDSLGNIGALLELAISDSGIIGTRMLPVEMLSTFAQPKPFPPESILTFFKFLCKPFKTDVICDGKYILFKPCENCDEKQD